MNYLPDDELLSAYLDGELTSEERAAVEARLADDPAWRTALAELREVQAEVQSLPLQKLPPVFAERVLSRLPAIVHAAPPRVAGYAANDNGTGAACVLENRADGNGAAQNTPCNAANLLTAQATATSSTVLGTISGLPLAAVDLASTADMPTPLPARRAPVGFQRQRIAAAVAVLAAGVLVMLAGGPALEGSRPAARNTAAATADRKAPSTDGKAFNQTAAEKQTLYAQDALVVGGGSSQEAPGFGALPGGGPGGFGGGGLGTIISGGPGDGGGGVAQKAGFGLQAPPAYPAGVGVPAAPGDAAPANHSMKAVSAAAPKSPPPSPRGLDRVGAARPDALPAGPQPQAEVPAPRHENLAREPARGFAAEGEGSPLAREAAERLRKLGEDSLSVVELSITQSAWERGDLLGILDRHSIAWEPASEVIEKSDEAVVQNMFSERRPLAEAQSRRASSQSAHGPADVKLVVLDAPIASLNRLLADLQARAGDGKALLSYHTEDAVTEREDVASMPRSLSRRKAAHDTEQAAQGTQAKFERRANAIPSAVTSDPAKLTGGGTRGGAEPRDTGNAPGGGASGAEPTLHAGFAYRLRTTSQAKADEVTGGGDHSPSPARHIQGGRSASATKDSGKAIANGALGNTGNLQRPATQRKAENQQSTDRGHVLLLIRVVPDGAPAPDPTAPAPADAPSSPPASIPR